MALPIKRYSFVSLLLVFAAGVATPVCAEPNDTQELLRTANDASAEDRYDAIDDLGERHEATKTVIPALVKLLHDDDPKVRWRSARSLGDYAQQAQSAVGELQKSLKDSDRVVQYHAALALGKIGDRSDATVNALMVAVTGTDAMVARAAISALRNLELDPKRVVAVLDRVLQSDDPVVVAHAIEAAVERGDKAVPVLNEALKRPSTAYIACAAIEQIGPDAAAAVPALTELISETKHSQLLIQALVALASIGPEAKSASPQIIPLLEHPTDRTVPVAAAYALGSIGAGDADDALRSAMSNPNEMLQMVAAWSLARLHPDDAQLKKQAVEKLQAGLESPDPAMQAAAEKGLKLLETPANDTGSN